jgi:hypothetical protein
MLQAIVEGFGIAVGKLYRGDSFKETKRWKMFIYLNFQHFPLHKTYDEKKYRIEIREETFHFNWDHIQDSRCE